MMKWYLSFLLAVVGCVSSACSRQPYLAANSSTAVPANTLYPETNLPVKQDVTSLASRLPQPEEIEIIEAGEGFHGDEISARTGQRWLGLYVNEQDSQLIWSKLKIELVEDAIVDVDKPGQKTGKRVLVDRKQHPVFLIRNATMLRPGKVVTILRPERFEGQVLNDRQPVRLQLGDLEYELVMMGDAPSVQANIVPASNPRLFLRQGATEQTVLQLEQGDQDSGWELRWAGDLDGDGKLDFYADLTNHYNVSWRRLFLSSAAPAGMLVKQVAEFVTTGC